MALGAQNVPFAIVAGDAGKLSNPLITGTNDAVVAVEETKLEGADQHRVVKSIHTTIMNCPEAIRITDEFLSS